jgi:DNA-binding XRE family transcriptional regulator
MDKEARKAIEESGFRVSTVKDFLGLTEEENQIIELKVAIAGRIRELRKKNKITQYQLASKLKSSQSRVAKIESADPGVSLDLMVRAFFVLGGKPTDMTAPLGRLRTSSGRRAQPAPTKGKAGKPTGGLVGNNPG